MPIGLRIVRPGERHDSAHRFTNLLSTGMARGSSPPQRKVIIGKFAISKATELFRSVPDEDVNRIVELCTEKGCAKDQTIMQKGTAVRGHSQPAVGYPDGRRFREDRAMLFAARANGSTGRAEDVFVAVAREAVALQASAHAGSWRFGAEDERTAGLEAGTLTFWVVRRSQAGYRLDAPKRRQARLNGIEWQ